jgi:hypothetical protein
MGAYPTRTFHVQVGEKSTTHNRTFLMRNWEIYSRWCMKRSKKSLRRTRRFGENASVMWKK